MCCLTRRFAGFVQLRAIQRVNEMAGAGDVAEGEKQSRFDKDKTQDEKHTNDESPKTRDRAALVQDTDEDEFWDNVPI